MPDEITPDAQEPQVVAETPNTSVQEVEPKVEFSAGVQKRIDEITREKHEALRLLEAQRAETQEMYRLMAEKAFAATPAAAVPQVEIEPEEKAKYDAYLGAHTRKMEQQIAALQSQIVEQNFRQAVSSVGDPEIERKAQELYVAWQKQGKTGWTPDDAVTVAVGLKARGELAKVSASKANKQAVAQYNASAETTQFSHSNAPREVPQGALPANFNSLPLEKQTELLEKKLEGITF